MCVFHDTHLSLQEVSDALIREQENDSRLSDLSDKVSATEAELTTCRAQLDFFTGRMQNMVRAFLGTQYSTFLLPGNHNFFICRLIFIILLPQYFLV